jgi:hypothetical protein
LIRADLGMPSFSKRKGWQSAQWVAIYFAILPLIIIRLSDDNL